MVMAQMESTCGTHARKHALLRFMQTQDFTWKLLTLIA
jgi:hypothetical protein